MFGIGETELVIILVFAFLLFGPDKLPGIGRTVGRALRQFRDASNGFTEVVQSNIMDPAAEELKKSPKQRHAEEAARNGASASGDAGASGDANEVSTEGAEPQQHETFAQRKARLKAERDAAQKSKVTEPSAGDYYDDEDDADIDIDSDDDVEPVTADEPAAEPSPAAQPAPTITDTNIAKPTSAADLYAISQQHSSRRRAQEAQREEAAESQSEEVASSEEVLSDAASESNPGEEGGSTQA